MQKYIICCVLIFLLIFGFSITIMTLENQPARLTVQPSVQNIQSAKKLVTATPAPTSRQTTLSRQIKEQEENLEQEKQNIQKKELADKILNFERQKQARLDEERFLREKKEQENYTEQIATQELEALLLLAQELSALRSKHAQENTQSQTKEERLSQSEIAKNLEMAKKLALQKREIEHQEKATEELLYSEITQAELKRQEKIRMQTLEAKKAAAEKKEIEQQRFMQTQQVTHHLELDPPVMEPDHLPADQIARAQEIIKPLPKNAVLFSDDSIFSNNDVIAFYGHPNSQHMGIVGQFSLPELAPQLTAYAKEYDNLNGDRGVIPALYLIYGTCWPLGEIGYLSDKTTIKYIEYALEHNWIVILDHQIGKHSVDYAVNQLLPFLEYPNVHLALDPEWRTVHPMKEIGFVTGDEINEAKRVIENYLITNNYKGKRFLVLHQFQDKMIKNRERIKKFERIEAVHCADGFGSPRLKKESYNRNAQAKNIPLKSFKLFTKPTIEKAGYDKPLMTPKEVLSLNPAPVLIMIQ
ncbi:MAG: hypothetical protein ACRC4W_01435 [Treponemataceae bacterium]